MKWVDKDKIKDFLSTQWPDYIGGGKEVAISSRVEDVAKLINDFENPSLNGVKNPNSESNECFRSAEESDLKAEERDIVA